MVDQFLKNFNGDAPGEIVGLFGSNGSGKSTLYNIIIGQHMADKGKVIINNKDFQKFQS